MSQTRVKYTGSIPGADANTYTLFSTVSAGLPRGFFQLSGTKRFAVNLNNIAACTLKEYYSDDGGTNWIQRSEEAVAIPAAGDSNDLDYSVGSFRDWKLDLVNSGSAQTGLAPQMQLVDSHPSQA